MNATGKSDYQAASYVNDRLLTLLLGATGSSDEEQPKKGGEEMEGLIKTAGEFFDADNRYPGSEGWLGFTMHGDVEAIAEFGIMVRAWAEKHNIEIEDE